MQKKNAGRSTAGMALLVALLLLLVFSMLGTAYVRYMVLTYESTRADVQKLRGKHLGQSGVYAAIGEIEAAVNKGETPAEQYEFELPLYRTEQTDDGTLGRGQYEQRVTATVADESGLVNLNHAPDAVLRALGVPGEVLAERKAANFRPFVSVDDLRSRDYMNSQEFSALDLSVFTVFTGDRDGADVNLNAASAKVLAALFKIDIVEAQSLAAKRPFTSWQDVLQKIGREPSTFRIAATRQDAMPDGLSLTSDVYRILSTGSMKTPDTSRNGLHVDVEAVVRFTDESFAIRYWTEDPVEIVYSQDTADAAALLDEIMDAAPDADDAEESDEDSEADTEEDTEEPADTPEEPAEAV